MDIRLFVACICLLLFGRFAIAGPEQSVVQIINYAQRPSWIEPWRFSNVSGGLGSGFVIEGQRVMTNAHVDTLIEVGLPARYLLAISNGIIQIITWTSPNMHVMNVLHWPSST